MNRPLKPRPASTRPSYAKAVAWIAHEDEPGYTNSAEIMAESGLTVAFVADLWGKCEETVADDVALFRRREMYDASESTRSDIG